MKNCFRTTQIAIILLSLAGRLSSATGAGEILLPGTQSYRDCLTSLIGLSRVVSWVDEPIANLYDRVPTHSPVQTPDGIVFELSPRSMTTPIIFGLPGESPFDGTRGVSIIYMPEPRKLGVFSIFLDDRFGKLPRFPRRVAIPNLPVPWNEQIPSGVFALLYAMKMAQISPGDVSEATLVKIVEVKTGLELARMPEINAWTHAHPHDHWIPGHLVSKYFAATQLGRLVSTALIQAGHRVIGVSCADHVLVVPLARLKATGDIHRDPEIDTLLNGLNDETRVPFDFSPTLKLERW